MEIMEYKIMSDISKNFEGKNFTNGNLFMKFMNIFPQKTC